MIMHVHIYCCCVNLKHIHTHTTQQSGKRSVALLTFSQTITPTYTYICAYLHICSLSFTLVFLLRQSQTYQNKQRKKSGVGSSAVSARCAYIAGGEGREGGGRSCNLLPSNCLDARLSFFRAGVCVIAIGGET